MSSSGLTRGSLWNSKFICDEIIKSGDDTRLGNSRILSLGILVFFLGILDFFLGILEFLGFFLGVRGYSFA